jgi:uncharacterized protein with HEPN domain
MSKRSDRQFLSDIKEAAERIGNYLGPMTYEEFLKDLKTQDAVVRNLEIIGEAVKNLSPGLRKRERNIEWKDIAGMRDKIIHDYFGIQWDIVWSAIKDKLPQLKLRIEEMLNPIFKLEMTPKPGDKQ